MEAGGRARSSRPTGAQEVSIGIKTEVRVACNPNPNRNGGGRELGRRQARASA